MEKQRCPPFSIINDSIIIKLFCKNVNFCGDYHSLERKHSEGLNQFVRIRIKQHCGKMSFGQIYLAGALALSQCDLKDHLWKVRGESLKVCYHATPVPSDIADVKHNSWIKSAIFTEILSFPLNQILGTAQAFDPVSKDC